LVGTGRAMSPGYCVEVRRRCASSLPLRLSGRSDGVGPLRWRAAHRLRGAEGTISRAVSGSGWRCCC
jgi:hypothetical protein